MATKLPHRWLPIAVLVATVEASPIVVADNMMPQRNATTIGELRVKCAVAKQNSFVIDIPIKHLITWLRDKKSCAVVSNKSPLFTIKPPVLFFACIMSPPSTNTSTTHGLEIELVEEYDQKSAPTTTRPKRVGRAYPPGSSPADQPDVAVLVRPLYYTNRVVKKPASRVYRIVALARLFIYLLFSTTLFILAGSIAESPPPKSYGKQLAIMLGFLSPALLALIVVYPITFVAAWFVPLHRLARHSDEWLLAVIDYFLLWVAVITLLFVGIWTWSASYILILPALMLLVRTMILVKHIFYHDAPTRGMHSYTRFWWKLREMWPHRWDTSAKFLFGNETESGGYFSLDGDDDLETTTAGQEMTDLSATRNGTEAEDEGEDGGDIEVAMEEAELPPLPPPPPKPTPTVTIDEPESTLPVAPPAPPPKRRILSQFY